MPFLCIVTLEQVAPFPSAVISGEAHPALGIDLSCLT